MFWSRDKKARVALEWEQRIRQSFPFLFTGLQASILSNRYYPRHFGVKVIVIRAGNFDLKFSRDCSMNDDELIVDIAQVNEAREWRPLIYAILALTTNEEAPTIPPFKVFGTFTGLSILLQPIVHQLDEAFSRSNYPRTEERMDTIRRVRR
jgi:hypothetical protein